MSSTELNSVNILAGVTFQYPLVESWNQIVDKEVVVNVWGASWKPVSYDLEEGSIKVLETYECVNAYDAFIYPEEFSLVFPNLDLSK